MLDLGLSKKEIDEAVNLEKLYSLAAKTKSCQTCGSSVSPVTGEYSACDTRGYWRLPACLSPVWCWPRKEGKTCWR